MVRTEYPKVRIHISAGFLYLEFVVFLEHLGFLRTVSKLRIYLYIDFKSPRLPLITCNLTGYELSAQIALRKSN